MMPIRGYVNSGLWQFWVDLRGIFDWSNEKCLFQLLIINNKIATQF